MTQAEKFPEFRLLIHGGAGDWPAGALDTERSAPYQETLRRSLAAGRTVLSAGGPALEAVAAAVVVLEDSPLFNAGRGSVLNAAGRVETDASIMRGSDSAVGAVAALRGVRNPIRLARAVLESSPHVLLAGDGARAFAAEREIDLADDHELITPERKAQWQKIRAASPDRTILDHESPGEHEDAPGSTGTVGAVALDRNGTLAAATSTGGMVNKAVGRVGDSPIIGAGTFARDGLCAVSATGHGEFFIRGMLAGDLAARMLYGDRELDRAAREALAQVEELGGRGGLIALDARGNVASLFNTNVMFRGEAGPDGDRVAIFAD